jgi:hypothetical protein
MGGCELRTSPAPPPAAPPLAAVSAAAAAAATGSVSGDSEAPETRAAEEEEADAAAASFHTRTTASCPAVARYCPLGANFIVHTAPSCAASSFASFKSSTTTAARVSPWCLRHMSSTQQARGYRREMKSQGQI